VALYERCLPLLIAAISRAPVLGGWASLMLAPEVALQLGAVTYLSARRHRVGGIYLGKLGLAHVHSRAPLLPSRPVPAMSKAQSPPAAPCQPDLRLHTPARFRPQPTPRHTQAGRAPRCCGFPPWRSWWPGPRCGC
jgi:hypothetical protein